MSNIGYYNGKLGILEKMTVPMNDRACFFGDGIYESVLVDGDIARDLDAHIERFYQGAETIKISMDYSKEELKDILLSTAAHSDHETKLLYWQVTRGTAVRTHTFPESKANLWITVTKGQIPDMEKQLKLITLPDTRYLHCNIKTLNLLPNVMAAEQAKASGCDEAVFIRDGLITECSHSNIHMMKDHALFTAPADNRILPGIGRKNLIEVCQKLQIPVFEQHFTLQDLKNADYVLITSTTKICQLAASIDGLPIGQKKSSEIHCIQNLLWHHHSKMTDMI
ncbi:MAG: aminotransferase class IV [Lachnospiraceae bacterium]|nr:aminotransferase class IV [Lachnospiraceae bacterium]